MVVVARDAVEVDPAVVEFDVEWLLALASQHAEDAGLEAEVGDLQQIAGACWEAMKADEQSAFLQSKAVQDALDLGLMAGQPTAGAEGIAWVLASAERHGAADDADHEAGDLQDAIRCMWGCMGIGSKRRVLREECVSAVVESGGGARGLMRTGDEEAGVMEEDWEEVVSHFGLDDSFQYTAQQVADCVNAFTMECGVVEADAHMVHPFKRAAPTRPGQVTG